MASPELITSPDAPRAFGPYSPAIAVDGWCFVAGQVGWDADLTGLQERGPAEQTVQALRNIEALLRAAGAGLADIVRTTVYVSSLEIVGDVNGAYESVFSDAGVVVLPTRTTIGALLPVDVEIDAIARIPSSTS